MDLKSALKYMFLAIVFIACFTCFARADYNLILFAFAYILWDMKPFAVICISIYAEDEVKMSFTPNEFLENLKALFHMESQHEIQRNY